jgi:lactoylglutathione lyase
MNPTTLATAATPIPSLETGHVGLNVSDLARSQQFYRDVFGFKEMLVSEEAGRRFVFLTQDERIVLTLWEQSEGTFATARPGLHHLSFQVDSVERVEEIERRLHAIGAKIHHDGIVQHAEGWPSGGVYFEDPDGIRLEVFAPAGVHGHAPAGAAPTCGFF